MNRSYDQGGWVYCVSISCCFCFVQSFFYEIANVNSRSANNWKKKAPEHMLRCGERCHPDSNWRIKVLQTFALPLGYGTVKKWSGRRDSDPRHPPWQGGTLPTELLPHKCALGRNRTTDTVIFSHMLYRLSYQGRYGDPEGARTLDLQRDRLAL